MNYAKESLKSIRDHINSKMETNHEWLYRGLLVIYQRQTDDEQRSENTVHSNGVGFNGRDAQFGSDIAQKLIKIKWEETPYYDPLSHKQRQAVLRMMRKYAGQIARIAKEKAKSKLVLS